jgi:hypothetical protein
VKFCPIFRLRGPLVVNQCLPFFCSPTGAISYDYTSLITFMPRSYSLLSLLLRPIKGTFRKSLACSVFAVSRTIYEFIMIMLSVTICIGVLAAKLHAFLTSALDGDEWPVLHSALLLAEEPREPTGYENRCISAAARDNITLPGGI